MGRQLILPSHFKKINHLMMINLLYRNLLKNIMHVLSKIIEGFGGEFYGTI